MKTIERDGRVYEIGKLYTSKDGSQVVLKGLYCDGSFSVNKINHEGRWFTPELTEAKGSLEAGTIKQAPAKLIDGEPYMFDTIRGKYCGLYKFSLDAFAFGDVLVQSSMARNVIKLAPEEK